MKTSYPKNQDGYHYFSTLYYNCGINQDPNNNLNQNNNFVISLQNLQKQCDRSSVRFFGKIQAMDVSFGNFLHLISDSRTPIFAEGLKSVLQGYIQVNNVNNANDKYYLNNIKYQGVTGGVLYVDQPDETKIYPTVQNIVARFNANINRAITIAYADFRNFKIDVTSQYFPIDFQNLQIQFTTDDVNGLNKYPIPISKALSVLKVNQFNFFPLTYNLVIDIFVIYD